MAMRFGSKKVIYDKALELKDSLDNMLMTYTVFRTLIRNTEPSEQQELRELMGEQLWEIIHNDKAWLKTKEETEKFKLQILHLLKNLEQED